MGRFAVILLAVGLILFSSAKIPKNSLSQGLVLYVPLDDGAGLTAFDITKMTNVAPFVIGGGTWQLNKRVLFNGTNSAKIVLSKSSCLNLETSPCTVSFWCKRTGTGNRYIFCDLNAAASFYGPLGVVAVSSNKFFVGWNNATLLTGTTNEVSGAWVHVVYTRAGSTGAWSLKLFYNGRLDGSTSTAVNPLPQSSNGTPTIAAPGDYTGGTVFHYNGYVKEVMVWNRALTQEEIKTLYLSQLQNY